MTLIEEIGLDADPTVPSGQHGAMRWVAGNAYDRDDLDKSMRVFKNSKPTEFNRLLAQLEREYREGLKGITKTVEDAGPDNVVELLTRLLEEKPWLK